MIENTTVKREVKTDYSKKKGRAILIYNQKATTQRIFRGISAGNELPICLKIRLSYLLIV
jgi:hypothetical protein